MDYYSILGVDKTVSPEDLRKAYKKKSMQHHPDRGGDEEEFKKVNEAYQTLSDPDKRAAYDNPQTQFRFDTNSMNGVPPGFEDIFGQFGFNFQQPRRQPIRNRDITISHEITLEEAFTGKNVIATYKLFSGKEANLDITIPKGCKDGDKIRFGGMGDDRIPNAPRGDLYLKVRIKKEKNWHKEGDDLYHILEVNVLDLITGTEQKIKTPEGKGINLKIPKGTQADTTFSVKDYGFPNLRNGRRGNFYITIRGIVPTLDDEANMLIEKIKQSGIW